jgi:PAS domain S-box-containing protein
MRKGKLETIYVNLTYQPERDTRGDIAGILVVATDVTQQVQSRKKVEETGARLKTMIDQTPAPTLVLMGDELVVEQINAPMLEMIGRGEEVIGLPLIVSMPELTGQYVWEQVLNVYKDGVNFDQSEVLVPHRRRGVLQDHYYNISYRPLKEHGKITGMIQVAIDVTEHVLARRKIEESEAHLQLTRNAIPAMVFYLDTEQRYRSYNGAFMTWFKVDPTEALGKTTQEFIGEEAYAKVEPHLSKAYAGERVEFHMHAPKRIGGGKWLNIVYTPHKNVEGTVVGIIVHASDITEHILALKKIEESEARFRNLLQEAPVAAILFRGPDLIVEVANDLSLTYWGKSKNIIGKPLSEAAPELEDQQMIALVKGVYERGGIVSYAETPIRFTENGRLKDGYYSFSLKALYNSSGEVESVLSTGIDVTEQVNARKQIESKEKELRDLISVAPLGICVVSGIEARIEEVNDRFILISGKKAEQFKSATYWDVFPEIAEAFSPVLENVFKTGVKFSIAETELTLIRHGLPEKMFVTFDYVPIRNSNGEVSKIIIIVIDVTHQVEMRKGIEEAVVVRTRELRETNRSLQQSNQELEQFAYIASHDLQEPIRKISTFTQLLEFSIKDISEKSREYISKIYNSTDRMTKLIRDVLAFSQLNEDSDNFEKVDLNKIITTVKNDFELQIEQTQAVIEVSGLPRIDAIPTQMIQLFGNLMSNALKYRKSDVKPIIRISCSVAKPEKLTRRIALDRDKQHYHIEFSDNGIGFHKDHVDKIFKIFQRLHGKAEFEGTGIGLAIALKIIQKHQGHISAAVGENGGAVFNILLPETRAPRHT